MHWRRAQLLIRRCLMQKDDVYIDKARIHCSHGTRTRENIWSLGKLNHVALATPNLEASSALYRNLGATVSSITPLAEHGVYTVFVELANSKIELLHPLGENSPIKAFLEKNKSGGIHHICIEVDNIENALKDVKAKKIRVLGDGGTKIGAHGKPVVFLHPKDCGGVLIELEQA